MIIVIVDRDRQMFRCIASLDDFLSSVNRCIYLVITGNLPRMYHWTPPQG